MTGVVLSQTSAKSPFFYLIRVYEPGGRPVSMTVADEGCRVEIDAGPRVCGQCRSEAASADRVCPECGAPLWSLSLPAASDHRRCWASARDCFLCLLGNGAFWIGGPIFIVMTLRYAVTGWLIAAGILAAEIVRSLWVLTMLERRPTRITSTWRLAFHLGMTTAAFVVLEWVCNSGIREAYISGMQDHTIGHSIVGGAIAAIHLPPCLVGVMGLTRAWRLHEWDRWRAALVTAAATVLLMAVMHAAAAWMVLPAATCQMFNRSVATESR